MSDQELPEEDVVDESAMDAEDRTPNAADADAINIQLERAKREGDRTSNFWRAILATKEGRDELWKILNGAGVFRAPFVSNNGFPDNQATWFQAGKYAFVQGLYHQCMASDLEGTRQMLIEHDGGFKAMAPELKRRGARG